MRTFKKNTNRMLWLATATVGLGVTLAFALYAWNGQQPGKGIDSNRESKLSDLKKPPGNKQPSVKAFYRLVAVDPYSNEWRKHLPPSSEFLPATPFDLSTLKASTGFFIRYDLELPQPGIYYLDAQWYYRYDYNGWMVCYERDIPPYPEWKRIAYLPYASPAYRLSTNRPRCSVLLTARLPYYNYRAAQILSEEQFFELVHARSVLYSAAFGAILLLILYQLSLAVYSRKAIYFIYLASLLFYFLYQLGMTGYGVQLGLYSPSANDTAMLGLSGWCSLFPLFLTELYTSLRSNLILRYGGRVLSLIVLVLFAVDLNRSSNEQFLLVEYVGYTILLVLLLLALFGLFRRGWIGFWIFVAYISIISGIIVLGITNNGIWPLNIFSRHAALFGSMIEMIVLAVLMGVMLRNVQGSRFRSNAEEKLGKDMENKANEYARQLQTEILDRAAADLLLPLESIRAAASFPARTDVPSMNPSVLSTVALPPGSRTLLEEIREESSRMIRELQSLQKTSTNTPELPLSMALEETAAEALDFAMRSWKFRNTATKESVPLPDSARKTLKQFLRRMRADGAGPESRGRDGATLLSLDSDPATGGKDLEIRIRYGEESLAIVLPARQSHFRGEPIGPEMTGPRIADASQDVDILIFGADPVLQRYMELIARKNGLKLGVANLLEPIPEGGLIHILDLSQLSLEEPQSLEKMRNWLDDFPAESPLIALVGDGRLQLRDLDLDPGLDLLVYRPLNSDLFEMELLRLLYSARALRSPEKEYNIRKARSEARLQNTLRRVLGRQLERIQELAGNYGKSEADLTASREELDRRIRAAQSSLKQILRSMSD